MRNASVVIVQERLTDYRIEFFDLLREELVRRGVHLELLYGVPEQGDPKGDGGVLPWASACRVFRWPVAGRRLTYIACLRECHEYDGVILEYAGRHLHTFLLLLLRSLGLGPRVAWWGHGANLQLASAENRIVRAVEALKRRMTKAADYCFAYTHGSAERFIANGFPRQDVTVVNNSVDTAWASGVQSIRNSSSTVGYMGSLYSEKRVELLLAASDRIESEIPGFRLKVAGDGELMPLLQDAATTRPWLEIWGRVKNEDKADFLEDVTLLLNPGLVGLVAVDSLASGRPIVTLAGGAHSPEFEYLKSGVNCVIVDGGGNGSESAYASAVIELLKDRNRVKNLSKRCLADSRFVSLSQFVSRFADGVEEFVGTAGRQVTS